MGFPRYSVVVVVGGFSAVLGSSNGKQEVLLFCTSCPESVLQFTNCPLVLACCGLGTAVTFCGHFHFGFRVYFLYLIKYMRDYPHIALTVYSLSPLPAPLCWYDERGTYKYWVLRKNSTLLNVSIEQFCDTLVLISSTSSASLLTSSFFNIPWERVSWLFFRLFYACFLVGPLAF